MKYYATKQVNILKQNPPWEVQGGQQMSAYYGRYYKFPVFKPLKNEALVYSQTCFYHRFTRGKERKKKKKENSNLKSLCLHFNQLYKRHVQNNDYLIEKNKSEKMNTRIKNCADVWFGSLGPYTHSWSLYFRAY